MRMPSIRTRFLLVALVLMGGCAEPSSLRTRPLTDFNARIDMDGRESPAIAFLVAGTDPNDDFLRPTLLVERYEPLGDGLVDVTSSTGYVRVPLRIVAEAGALSGSVAIELSVLREVQHDSGPLRTTDSNVRVEADGTFSMSGTTGELPGDIAFSASGALRTACATWTSNAVQLEASAHAGEVEVPIENGVLVVRCDGSGFDVR